MNLGKMNVAGACAGKLVYIGYSLQNGSSGIPTVYKGLSLVSMAVVTCAGVNLAVTGKAYVYPGRLSYAV